MSEVHLIQGILCQYLRLDSPFPSYALTIPNPSHRNNAIEVQPTQVVDVFVRLTGGKVGAASSLGSKIGPLGLFPNKIDKDIAKKTAKDWKGLRIAVKLMVENRQSEVTVVPSAAALTTLKEPEHDRKKIKNIKHNENISLDDIIDIVKVMRPRSMAKDLAGSVKEILGVCVSVGCTIDGKDSKDCSRRSLTAMSKSTKIE